MLKITLPPGGLDLCLCGKAVLSCPRAVALVVAAVDGWRFRLRADATEPGGGMLKIPLPPDGLEAWFLFAWRAPGATACRYHC